MPGGDYLATQNPDGTWNIHDVPFLPAHRIPVRDAQGKAIKDEDGNPMHFTVDREWLEASQYAAQSRFEMDTYLPPLHIEHKGTVPRTELAGRFKLREVRPGNYEGKRVDMLYGELAYIPDAVYQDIRAGKYPYLSPEIHNLKRSPEVDSIALMDDTVPHFRLPMLTIGEERPYRAEPQLSSLAASGPVISYSAKFGGGAILQASGEMVMENEMGSEGLKHLVGTLADASSKLMKYLDGAGEEETTIEVEADEVNPAPAEQMMDEEEGDGEILSDQPEIEDTDDDETSAMLAAKSDAQKDVKVAALERHQAKLQAEVDAMNHKARVQERIEGALETLKSYGLEGPEFEANVKKYAAKSDELVNCYVDTVKENRELLPPSVWDGEQGYAGPVAKDREFITNLPAEDQPLAAQLCHEYETSGFAYSASKEEFVQRSLASRNGRLNPTKGGN